MNIPTINVISETDRDKAIHTTMLGFSTDPFLRWMYPNASSYLNAGPAFDAFGGGSIDHGSAFAANDFEGVAMWMPPGAEADEERFVEEVEKHILPEKHETLFAVLEEMGKFHPKDAWYLPTIAVDPACQGKGIGSQLMKHALAMVDAKGLTAYLESSNPRNMSLYERCGFVTMGKIQIGEAPVIHPMIREAT